jgi:hypothetical protein
MPDSFGKRARREVNAKNAASREARRIARNQRKKDRAAGIDVPPPGLEDEAREESLDDHVEPEERA